MEIKINKEIKEYNETIFFGLSARQFIFSVLACLAAVGIYFLLKPYLDTETLSWVCILGAVPFAALGFIKYNGMNAEQICDGKDEQEHQSVKRISFFHLTVYLNQRSAVRSESPRGACFASNVSPYTVPSGVFSGRMSEIYPSSSLVRVS